MGAEGIYVRLDKEKTGDGAEDWEGMEDIQIRWDNGQTGDMIQFILFICLIFNPF